MGEISAKQLRKMDAALTTIYSPRGIGAPKFEGGGAARPGWLSREIRLTNYRELQLTEVGFGEFRFLVTTIEAADFFSGAVNHGDIWSASKHVIQTLLSEGQMPDNATEFITLVREHLERQTSKRFFVVPVQGIELKQDIQELKLGTLKIIRPSTEALTQMGVTNEREGHESTVALMGWHPWLVGSAFGSKSVARQRFEFHAEQVLGLLAAFAGAIFQSGASPFRLALRMSAEKTPTRAVFLSWDEQERSVETTHHMSSNLVLRVDGALVDSFHAWGVFDEAFALVENANPSPLEEALVRAIYWFSDAQRDTVSTMQFVKYWSCVETIFNDKNCVVSSVTRGLATVLVAGGYEFFPPGEYRDLKKKIEKMYGMRSDALHAAMYRHISSRTVSDLSQWVAWMLINTLHFIRRGYQTPAELQAQCKRLDQVLLKAGENLPPPAATTS